MTCSLAPLGGKAAGAGGVTAGAGAETGLAAGAGGLNNGLGAGAGKHSSERKEQVSTGRQQPDCWVPTKAAQASHSIW